MSAELLVCTQLVFRCDFFLTIHWHVPLSALQDHYAPLNDAGGGIILHIFPGFMEHQQQGLGMTASDFHMVTGWPNNVVNMFYCGGSHANPMMASWINFTLAVQAKLEQEHHTGVFQFNAGLYENPDSPFIALGPMNMDNEYIIFNLIKDLPREWRHLYATNNVSSIH